MHYCIFTENNALFYKENKGNKGNKGNKMN